LKRYYAHYTFIYPDTFLKNHIVELSDEGIISSVCLFEKEVAGTEFFSGIQLFIPEEIVAKGILIDTLAGLSTELAEVINGRDYLIRSFRV